MFIFIKLNHSHSASSTIFVNLDDCHSIFVGSVKIFLSFGCWLIEVLIHTKGSKEGILLLFLLLRSVPCACVVRNLQTIFFLICPFARWGWKLLALFDVHICLPNKVDGWLLESLGGWSLKDKVGILWKLASKALLWNLQLERNIRLFEDRSTSFEFFGIMYSLLVMPYLPLSMILLDWQAIYKQFFVWGIPPPPALKLLSLPFS